MTPEPDADVAAVREALSSPFRDGWRDAVAALDRLAARLQEAEREREAWRADYTRIDTAYGKDVLALKAREAALREEMEERKTRSTLVRLHDAKVIGAIFDHSREALEAAYAEFERAEEHHRWHHEQSPEIEYHDDDERLRVLMLIAEALEELPEPLSEDAETQTVELHEGARAAFASDESGEP